MSGGVGAFPTPFFGTWVLWRKETEGKKPCGHACLLWENHWSR